MLPTNSFVFAGTGRLIGMIRPKAGDAGGRTLSYGEARAFVDRMKYAEAGRLFGNEKDEPFKAALGAIYQTVGAQDVCPSIQEKAANLLYLVVKDHAFSDGKKRQVIAKLLGFFEKYFGLV